MPPKCRPAPIRQKAASRPPATTASAALRASMAPRAAAPSAAAPSAAAPSAAAPRKSVRTAATTAPRQHAGGRQRRGAHELRREEPVAAVLHDGTEDHRRRDDGGEQQAVAEVALDARRHLPRNGPCVRVLDASVAAPALPAPTLPHCTELRVKMDEDVLRPMLRVLPALTKLTIVADPTKRESLYSVEAAEVIARTPRLRALKIAWPGDRHEAADLFTAEMLPKICRGLRHLTSLDLSGSGSSLIDETLDEAIALLPSLTELRLVGCFFLSDGALCGIEKLAPQLELLDLTATSVKHALTLLPNLQRLHTLRFGFAGNADIAKALASMPSLRCLTIDTWPDQGSVYLLGPLLGRLTSFDLSVMSGDPLPLLLLSGEGHTMTSMTSLRLRQHASHSAITTALRAPLLQSLTLERAELADLAPVGGACAFAQIRSRALTSLSLPHALCTDEGQAAALFEALRSAPSLRSLSLSSIRHSAGTGLSNAACVALVRSVVGLPHLQTLDLSDCALSNEAFVKAAASGAVPNPRLCKLNLSGNDVTHECFAALAQLWPCLKELTAEVKVSPFEMEQRRFVQDRWPSLTVVRTGKATWTVSDPL